MTEPQVWVLIGVFATAIFGMMTWQTVNFNRALVSAVERLEAKFDGKFDAMSGKIEVINAKIDNLDRDVQALTRHVFGADPR